MLRGQRMSECSLAPPQLPHRGQHDIIEPFRGCRIAIGVIEMIGAIPDLRFCGHPRRLFDERRVAIESQGLELHSPGA